MNICFFFGTFNPIHNAHLRMARFVLGNFGFDKIVFVPAYNPPHKNIVGAEHRLNMVRLATEGIDKFEVSDVEFVLGNTSYTYLTILELMKTYNDCEKFNFIIGTDAFEKIESWYEIDKLKKLLKFIVFYREDACDVSKFDYLKDKGFEFCFTSLDFCDISSTEIRQKIVCNHSLSGLVTKEVEDYICANNLYR